MGTTAWRENSSAGFKMFTCYICAQRLPLATWKTGNNKAGGMRNTRQLPGSQVFVTSNFHRCDHSSIRLLTVWATARPLLSPLPVIFQVMAYCARNPTRQVRPPKRSLRLRAEFERDRNRSFVAWNVMSSSCVLISRVTFNGLMEI